MCKHKSGGMSRPSSNANQNQTDSVDSNDNATCDNSQIVDEASSQTANERQEIDSVHLQLTSIVQEPSASRRYFPTIAANMGVQNADSSVVKDVSGVQQLTVDLTPLKANDSSPHRWNERRDMESDEEHISEKSPMLGSSWNSIPKQCVQKSVIAKNCDLPTVCICDGTSNSYVDFGKPHNNFPYASCSGESDNYKMEANVLSGQCNVTDKMFPRSLRNHQSGGGCVVIDNVTDFIELNEDNVEEIELSAVHGCECNGRSGKRWLFSRHKCHSLDSSTKPARKTSSSILSKSRSLTQNVSDIRQMENIEESSLEKSNDNYPFSISENVNDVLPGPSQIQRPSSIHGVTEGIKDFGDEEFRSRSFSLTPTINFAIFETESSSDTEECVEQEPTLSSLDNYNTHIPEEKQCLPQTIQLPIVSRALPGCPSAAQLSLASSLGDGPICKICHMSGKDGDQLISPCRCAGTMQYIHCGCLMRWLEISSKKSRKPPSCELCQYQYQWHKKFKVRHWQFPHCSRRDKVLHFLFFISVVVMVACATITIMCFKQDKGTRVDPDRTELTQSEIVTLVCGVLFFLAFFVAMYVEVKARNTIYKLLAKFVYLNQQWYIDEYDKKDSAPVAV